MRENKFSLAIEKYSVAISKLLFDNQSEKVKVVDLQLRNNYSIALFKLGQTDDCYNECVFILK
jgi:hypothetical protein